MSDAVLTIHRCAHEIGGNCIEIAYDGHRILLDAGSPLDAGDAPPSAQMPATLDLERPVDAVLISHPHLDHFGLLRALPAEWPVWSGAAAEALIRMTARLGGGSIAQSFRNYRHGRRFRVGPFAITPFLTDHSAFDAHMLLVEVGGRRVLYSGDFRRTGRKAALVDRLMARPPSDVDVLLLEGTTLGRAEGFPTEADLEERFVQLFERTKGRVFVSWSAQNIDRTVTIYRACRRAGRTLALDLYTLDVLDRLASHVGSLPRLGWPAVRGVVTTSMLRMYRNPRRMGRPAFAESCVGTGRCVGAARLEGRSDVVMLRPSLFRDFVAKGVQLRADDAWVFSQWRGYAEKGGYAEVREAFEAVGARVEHIHTSGHASRGDLVRFAEAVAAGMLVPVHSFDWDEHVSAFPNVRRIRDGAAVVVPAGVGT